MNRLSAGGDIEGNKQENFSDMSSDLRVLEALLFAATEPVTEKSLQERLQPGADLGLTCSPSIMKVGA